jgi:hypothetical protein
LTGDAFRDRDLALMGGGPESTAGAAAAGSSLPRCGRAAAAIGTLIAGRPRAGSTGGGAKPGSMRPRKWDVAAAAPGRPKPGGPQGGHQDRSWPPMVVRANRAAINRLSRYRRRLLGPGRAGARCGRLLRHHGSSRRLQLGQKVGTRWNYRTRGGLPGERTPGSSRRSDRSLWSGRRPGLCGVSGRRAISGGRGICGAAVPGPGRAAGVLGGSGCRGPERICPGRGGGALAPGGGVEGRSGSEGGGAEDAGSPAGRALRWRARALVGPPADESDGPRVAGEPAQPPGDR